MKCFNLNLIKFLVNGINTINKMIDLAKIARTNIINVRLIRGLSFFIYTSKIISENLSEMIKPELI